MENRAFKDNDCAQFIDRECIEYLEELFDLCKFDNKKDKDKFWKAVSTAANCNAVHEIRVENFESAVMKAKALLQKRGADVFRPWKSRTDYLSWVRLRYEFVQAGDE